MTMESFITCEYTDTGFLTEVYMPAVNQAVMAKTFRRADKARQYAHELSNELGLSIEDRIKEATK